MPRKSPPEQPYYELDPAHTDPARVKREREKARALRKTAAWARKVAAGLCHYCGERFAPAELTLDHLVPIARGGTSTLGNCVPACKECNSEKGLRTPVEDLFAQLEEEKKRRGQI
jgi:5-methylcytosine-specific restriction endonuclease McrA